MFNKIELDFNSFEDIPITIRLYGEQLKAIKELALQNNRALKDQLELMMTAGSIYDIQSKIDFWQKKGC